MAVYLSRVDGSNCKIFITKDARDTSAVSQTDKPSMAKLKRHSVGLGRVDNSEEVVAFLKRDTGNLEELTPENALVIFKKANSAQIIKQNNTKKGAPCVPTSVFEARKQDVELYKEFSHAALKWWERKVARNATERYFNYETFRAVQLNTKRAYNEFALTHGPLIGRAQEKALQWFGQTIHRYQQKQAKAYPDPVNLNTRGTKKHAKRKRKQDTPGGSNTTQAGKTTKNTEQGAQQNVEEEEVATTFEQKDAKKEEKKAKKAEKKAAKKAKKEEKKKAKKEKKSKKAEEEGNTTHNNGEEEADKSKKKDKQKKGKKPPKKKARVDNNAEQ